MLVARVGGGGSGSGCVVVDEWGCVSGMRRGRAESAVFG